MKELSVSRDKIKCPLCGGWIFNAKAEKRIRVHPVDRMLYKPTTEADAEWRCENCGAAFSAHFEFINGSIITKEREVSVEYDNQEITPCGEIQRRW